jgi:hypothetical protein
VQSSEIGMLYGDVMAVVDPRTISIWLLIGILSTSLKQLVHTVRLTQTEHSHSLLVH